MTRITKLLATAAIICSLGSSPANTKDLDEPTKVYTGLVIFSMYAQHNCKMTPDIDALIKTGERMGVDFGTVVKAVLAAIAVNADQPYESKDLVPEITRQVRELADVLLSSDKDKNCSGVKKILDSVSK